MPNHWDDSSFDEALERADSILSGNDEQSILRLREEYRLLKAKYEHLQMVAIWLGVAVFALTVLALVLTGIAG